MKKCTGVFDNKLRFLLFGVWIVNGLRTSILRLSAWLDGHIVSSVNQERTSRATGWVNRVMYNLVDNSAGSVLSSGRAGEHLARAANRWVVAVFPVCGLLRPYTSDRLSHGEHHWNRDILLVNRFFECRSSGFGAARHNIDRENSKAGRKATQWGSNGWNASGT